MTIPKKGVCNMNVSPIPLAQRLSSLHRLGFSDAAVLPHLIRTWGNAPCRILFP